LSPLPSQVLAALAAPSLGERVALRLEQCLRDKPDLRALLQGLLDPNPSKRTRASAALKSKFLQGHVSTAARREAEGRAEERAAEMVQVLADKVDAAAEAGQKAIQDLGRA